MKGLRSILTFAILFGFLGINYGFANWSLDWSKWSIPIGHLLSFGALAAAFIILKEKRETILEFLKEPAIIAWLILSGISLIHLVHDLPAYGGYAARDASFVAEGAFLFLGFLWARSDEDKTLFLRGLGLVFLLTFLYSLSVLWAGWLASTSPISGIFQPVPILGNYSFIYFPLQVGGLFFILVAPRTMKWPAAFLWALAILQIGWMFYFQARSTYVTSLVLILLALAMTGLRQALRISALHVAGFIALIALSSLFHRMGNINLIGRNGEVNPTFYAQHLETINPNNNLPNVSPTKWRLEIWREAIGHWLATPVTILVGEGFGKPLTDYVQIGGYTGNAVPATTVSPGQFSVAVRQPHDIHLTVLARLGIIGFLLWAFINVRIIYLFVRSLWKEPKESFEHALKLWLFLFYITGMILASLQPWLEFSYGAIPFYIVLGFSIAILTKKPKDLIEESYVS